jgi:hypothetical protein
MNILGAIVAGLVATAIFTMVMLMAPKMDIVSMLGTMFGKENRALGWITISVSIRMIGLFSPFVDNSRSASYSPQAQHCQAGLRESSRGAGSSHRLVVNETCATARSSPQACRGDELNRGNSQRNHIVWVQATSWSRIPNALTLSEVFKRLPREMRCCLLVLPGGGSPSSQR